jgi:DNA polymerase-4
VAYIAPGREAEFLAGLPIEKLPGVGHKTARLLHDLNIRTVAELATLDRATLAALMGARGEAIYERCRGREPWQELGAMPKSARACPPAGREDQRKTCPRGLGHGTRPPPTAEGGCATRTERAPRTISRETTFHRPTCDLVEIRGMLFYLLERAMRMARSRGLAVGGVVLSIRYDDWKQLDARRTLPQPTAADEEVFQEVGLMLGQLHKRRVALRHVGVVLDKFSPLSSVGRLFDPPAKVQRRELYQALDAIRDRFGYGAMVNGESIALLGQLRQNDYGFVLRTPSLTK